MPYLLRHGRLTGKIVLLALITLTLLPNLAMANPKPGPNRCRPEGAPPHFGEFQQHNEQLLMDLLSLTEKQRQQMQQLSAEKHQAMMQSRKQLDAIHELLRKQMEADVIDKTLVRSLFEQQAAIKAEEMISAHQQDKQLALILTKEQGKKAEALRRLFAINGKPGPRF